MVSRRQFLKITGGGGGLLLTAGVGLTRRSFAAPIPGGTLDPLAIPKYALPLIVPPAMPKAGTLRSPGGAIDYYEIAVRQFKQRILPPGLPVTTVWGYGSPRDASTFNYPGYTIEAAHRQPVRIKWMNQLKDSGDRYLPHLLPVDPTLHWANPGGGQAGRDTRPTFTQGVPARYTGPVPIVPHLHGGHSNEDSDGYPTAWFLPNAGNIPETYARAGSQREAFGNKFLKRTGVTWNEGYSVYQYENDQRATTLWYHDHTLGMTRANVYTGLAGFYNLRGGPGDLVLDAATGLAATLPGPAPMPHDKPGLSYCEIPLAIQDRAFNVDGSLFYPDSRVFFDGFSGPYIGDTMMPSDISPIWNPEFFGNTMVVNGRTWPFLVVEPRRYRLRVLNGCGSRFLMLKLSNGLPFWQIGADGGFLPQPVPMERLLMAPGERVDVIVDLSNQPVGSTITLLNLGPDEPFGGGEPNVDFAAADAATTGQVMQFRVAALSSQDLSTPPDRLLLPAIAPEGPVARVRKVSLNEMMSMMVPDPNDPTMMAGPQAAMLGTVMLDPAGMPMGMPMMWGDAITERPGAGTTELWEIYNFTEDAHPVHLHQTMFEIVNREVFDPLMGMAGMVMPPEPGETGRKDIVIAYPGQITRLRARFDLRGLYVWHCHILEHEDNEMMRPLLVV